MRRRGRPAPMLQPKGRAHPSGRPVITDVSPVTLPIVRTTPDEPLTPGLRRNRQTYAIGFTAQIGAFDDDGE